MSLLHNLWFLSLTFELSLNLMQLLGLTIKLSCSLSAWFLTVELNPEDLTDIAVVSGK